MKFIPVKCSHTVRIIALPEPKEESALLALLVRHGGLPLRNASNIVYAAAGLYVGTCTIQTTNNLSPTRLQSKDLVKLQASV